MSYARILFGFAALACAGCPSEDSDDSGASTDQGTTTSTSTTDSTPESTGDESSGPHDTEHETTTSGESGSETAGAVCDIIGEGCHDNMTPEGIECHLVGHDGDEALCQKAYEMCAELCGL